MVPWAEGIKFPPLKDNSNEETMGMMRSKRPCFLLAKILRPDVLSPILNLNDLDAFFPSRILKCHLIGQIKKTMVWKGAMIFPGSSSNYRKSQG